MEDALKNRLCLWANCSQLMFASDGTEKPAVSVARLLAADAPAQGLKIATGGRSPARHAVFLAQMFANDVNNRWKKH